MGAVGTGHGDRYRPHICHQRRGSGMEKNAAGDQRTGPEPHCFPLREGHPAGGSTAQRLRSRWEEGKLSVNSEADSCRWDYLQSLSACPRKGLYSYFASS